MKPTAYEGTTNSSTQTRKIWQQWESLYFWFDDENKMNYKNILTITKTLMGQLNIYNPTCYEENKDGVREN